MVHAPLRLPWPVVAAGFALGHRAAVRVEFGKEGHLVNLVDAALIPAIVFTGPGRVVLASIVGTVAYAVWVRRTVTKAAFNVCLHALATTLGVISFHLVAGPTAALSGRGVAASVIAVLITSVVTDVAIQAVIYLSTGLLETSRFSQLAVLVAAIVGVNSALGLTAVLMIRNSPVEGSILFVLVGAAIAVGYSIYGSLRLRHARLEQLYQFDQALAGMMDPDAVILAVLSEARKLLNAEVAELVVSRATAFVRYTLGAGDDRPRMTSVEGNAFADAMASCPDGLVAPRGGTDAVLARTLSASGHRDAVAAPLLGEETRTKVLIVADRQGDHLTFDTADLTLLKALASHSAIALRSSDIHALKNHQASHDALTGLANRVLFASVLEQAIADREGEMMVGVMLMDLDGFKEINDTLGHDIGDRALQHLADNLRTVVGDQGLIARLGGDEFAVTLPHARSVREVLLMARELSLAVEEPLRMADATVEMRASIGVAVAPLHGEDRSSLMRRADATMYRAKDHGGGVAVHDHRQDGARLLLPSLTSDLRKAIDSAAIGVAYQPIADMGTGAITGAEALVRWSHPTQGPMAPEQFIPIAERSGLIRPLTRLVMDTALRQLTTWRREDPALSVSVNLSPCMLDDPDIVAHLEYLLGIHRLPAEAVIIELTESSVGGNRDDDHRILERLAATGVRLAIDDYGTGYSSLARLKDLPFTELKMDRSFIADLPADRRACSMVASTIALARDLGVHVVAEGVETLATWECLRRLRCEAAQGYFIAPALSGAAFAGWLQERQTLAM